MRARDWVSAIYDTEEILGLYWRWPFVDMADMIATWDAIKASPAWLEYAGEGPWPLEFHREHRWRVDTGIRRIRGTWVFDVGVGMACGGTLLHEVGHIPGWRRSKPHGDGFLRLWLALWKQEARTITWNAIVEQLRKGGVPVEEFV
ncbi:MAG: hypothetical protein WC935_00185 [Thermoleophilia bacterium]